MLKAHISSSSFLHLINLKTTLLYNHHTFLDKSGTVRANIETLKFYIAPDEVCSWDQKRSSRGLQMSFSTNFKYTTTEIGTIVSADAGIKCPLVQETIIQMCVKLHSRFIIFTAMCKMQTVWWHPWFCIKHNRFFHFYAAVDGRDLLPNPETGILVWSEQSKPLQGSVSSVWNSHC